MRYIGQILAATALIFLSIHSFGYPAAALNLDSEINSAIQDLDQAQEYHLWDASLNHPNQLFSRIEQSVEKGPLAKSLCEKILALKNSDLAVFEQSFENHSLSSQLSCRTTVLHRLSAYFQAAQDQILSHAQTLYPQTKRGSNLASKSFLGPSFEMSLDVQKGPTFLDAGLPSKHIALTFDDGPHSKHTRALLDVLHRENVQVTFFMVGQNVLRFPDIVKDVEADQHSIGNHTWSHEDLRKHPLDFAADEIIDGFEAIWDVLGYSAPYFRFPYGARTKDLTAFVKTNSWGSFLWNIDTLDWKYRDPAFLFDYALEQIEKYDRGIVLFHDIQSQTIAIMPGLLQALKAKGFVPVVFRSNPVGPNGPLP